VIRREDRTDLVDQQKWGVLCQNLCWKRESNGAAAPLQ